MRMGRRILVLLGAALLMPACDGGGSSSGSGAGAAPDSSTDAAQQAGLGGGQPPFVRIITPASGSSCHEGATINLQAVAVDPDTAIVRVEFFEGARLLGARTAPPFIFAWSGASPGSHILTAVAFDVSGQSAGSAPVTVFVIARGDDDSKTRR